MWRLEGCSMCGKLTTVVTLKVSISEYFTCHHTLTKEKPYLVLSTRFNFSIDNFTPVCTNTAGKIQIQS